jgi:hypothetical protein
MTKSKTEAEVTIEELTIIATTRDDIIFELRSEHCFDQKGAQDYYNTYHKSTMAGGFIGLFDSALVEKDLSDEAVTEFVKEHGSANTLRHLSSYKARAKLARDVRASLKSKK